MSFKFRVLVALPVLLWCGLVAAQDNVTIPKSRLQELEQKEAELEKLRGKASSEKQQQPPVAPAPSHTTPTAAPVIRQESTSLANLPPFREGEVVEAADLANYYRQDRAAADQRFRNKKVVIRGEIAGFGKPLFKRNYRVLLEGDARDTNIACDFVPPEKYSAVFPADDGQQLVGLIGETRVPLAKTHSVVLVDGVCKGLKKSAVVIYATGMKAAP